MALDRLTPNFSVDLTRRGFLSAMGFTAAGAAVAEKTGLLDKLWRAWSGPPIELWTPRPGGPITPATLSALNDLFKEVYGSALADLMPSYYLHNPPWLPGQPTANADGSKAFWMPIDKHPISEVGLTLAYGPKTDL